MGQTKGMPELDPTRYVAMRLADPDHRLPMPGSKRFFDKAGETIDLQDPFWAALKADGSIVPVEAAKTAAPAPSTGPSSSPVPDALMRAEQTAQDLKSGR